MCGITGFIDFGKSSGGGFLRETVRNMTDRLVHRGPDSMGVWVDPAQGIALGHRRLSILDLSPAGNQPMFSADGRYVVVFNGEMYNFRDLQKALEGEGSRIAWKGHSDTEILLEAVTRWGFEATLKRMVGMFAIALWDREEKTLFLARDRIGEKPLFFGIVGNSLVFGSELKALCAFPGWKGEVDRDALALFFEFSSVPAPYSIYKGIYKVVPGTFLEIRAGRFFGNPLSVSTLMGCAREYWSVRKAASDGESDPFVQGEKACVDHLDKLLRNSVKKQMVADVPLGAFLSGGIDSSTVVAMMQHQSPKPIKSFTIGFHESEFNEAPFARTVAEHLKTEHTELYVSADQARKVIPLLPDIYDEPFSDSSQIPTYLVSRMTQQHVTVSLSGDGGDELFGGYSRYFMTERIWNYLHMIPRIFRKAGGRLLKRMPGKFLNQAPAGLARFFSRHGRLGEAGDKLHKLADILDFDSLPALCRGVTTSWKHSTRLVPGASELPTVFSRPLGELDSLPPFKKMMYLDQLGYLPDDILAKVDRAGMAVSLETRMPFLDHRIVEFAWKIPVSLNVRDGKGKWLLRQLLSRYVPSGLFERKKMGFSIPLGDWLTGPLREWVETLINRERLAREGFLDPGMVRKKWEEHLSGEKNWQYQLWDVLMFQAWLEKK